MERRRRRRRRLRRRDAGRSRGAEAAEDVMDAPAGNRDGQRRVSDRKKKKKRKRNKTKGKKRKLFLGLLSPVSFVFGVVGVALLFKDRTKSRVERQ